MRAPVRGVPAGTPIDCRAGYVDNRGSRQRHRRVPHHPPGSDHPGASRPAQLRQTAGAGSASRRSRLPGGHERRVLQAPGARQRQRRSELVLEGLAQALQLDEAERAHLFDLARAANPVAPRRPRPIKQQIRPVVQRILDQIEAPATVRNARLNYVGANALGRALYAPLFDSREQPANSARFTFLDPAAHDFYPEWDRVATELVAHLRSEAGANPYDRDLSDLVGELSTRSDEFRVRWAAHNVRFHRTGTKHIHHPVVGDLELNYETMDLSADDGLSLAIFTAEVDSASQQALDLLASWTATPAAST